MSLDQIIALLPIISITSAALVVMLAITFKRNFALTSVVASIGIIVSLLAVMATWRYNPTQVTPLIRIDSYGLFYMALLLLAGLAVIAFCYDYFKGRNGENEELLILILTALLGGSVLAASSHFASFFIGLETLSVSLFVLIGYCFDRANALEAAIKYLILSGVSSTFLLMGMALIYAQCGALDFSGIERYIANQQQINLIMLGGIVFIVAGLGFKLSLVPFHMWTPDVYEGASSPVTAFVATVSKGAVFALLVRYLITSGGYLYSSLLTVLSIIAAVTILGGNFLALRQQNVKRLLAYSSIAHIGSLLVAVVASGSVLPNVVVEAVTFYMAAYFISTLGAFGVVSMLSMPQAEAMDLSLYQGLFWRRPWLAAAFTVMLLSLAGIPLTAGFIGKFYIFTVGAQGRLWGLMIALIIGSGLGLYYYLRIIVAMSMNRHRVADAKLEATLPFLSSVAIAILTILSVWFGVYPSYLMNCIQQIAQ